MKDQILMFVILVVLLLNRISRACSAPIISANYSADQLFKFDEQVQQPATFRALYHMELKAFISDIVSVVLLLYNDAIIVSHRDRYIQDQLILFHSKIFIIKLMV